MPNSVEGTSSKISMIASRDDEPSAPSLDNVALPAKVFVPVGETEIDCVVTALSPDCATFSTALASTLGSEIVLYIEGFDRFSASLIRTTQDSVQVRFHCSANKRARTAERIDCLRNGQPLPPTSLRRTEPSPLLHSVRTFKRCNGQTVDFEVIDISLTGASLRTKSRPAIDEVITIGSVEGRVTRHFEDGIAVEFARRTAPSLNVMR